MKIGIVTKPIHNHPTALSAIAFPQYRQFDQDTTNQIKDLSDAGLRPSLIESVLLQQDPEAIFLHKDIINERARIRQYNLNGLTPTQALLYTLDIYNKETIEQLKEADSNDIITELGYICKFHKDPTTERLDYIFWLHPASLAMLQNYYNILIIDCTYKTNCYNLPLCHITGRTSTGKTFDIDYCFINSERELVYDMVVAHLTEIFKDYLPGKQPSVLVIDKETALKNALCNSQFFGGVPQIICQWHVEMNVLTHTQAKWNEKIVRTKDKKKAIRELCRAFMARFTALLYCLMDNFDNTWAKIVQDYNEDAP